VPNIFIANETYVPVRWDYSDLEEKCAYYLGNEDERRRIASAAFEVLAGYYGRKGFLTSFTDILGRIGWGSSGRVRRAVPPKLV
jgi:spore maturation protein CgeB